MDGNNELERVDQGQDGKANWVERVVVLLLGGMSGAIMGLLIGLLLLKLGVIVVNLLVWMAAGAGVAAFWMAVVMGGSTEAER